MAWLTRINWLDTDTPRSADFNNIGNDIRTWGATVNANNQNLTALGQFLSPNQVRSFCTNSVVQSVATATWTTLSFDTNTVQVGSMHSTTTNPTRFVVPNDGVYRVSAVVSFNSNATGQRALRLLTNGVVLVFGTELSANSTDNTVLNFSIEVSVTAGTYIELQAFQASGAALNVLQGSTLLQMNVTQSF